MPMQQGVWTDEERWPSSEEPARCGEEHTIGILQARTNDLAAKNRELVSEHDDLDSLNSRERNRSAATASARRKSRYTSETSKSRPSSTTISYGPKARRINC